MNKSMRKLVFKEKRAKEVKKELFTTSGIIRIVDMSIVFKDIDSIVYSEILEFKNLEIDSAILAKIIASRFLRYSRFNKKEIKIDFEVSLYSKKEVDEYPFDRNNDIIILWFRKYYKEICKTRDIKNKFNIDLFIKNLKINKDEDEKK